METNQEIIGGVMLAPPTGEAPPTDAPISTRAAMAYSSGNIGSSIFYALNNYLLPVFLQNLGAPAVLRNLLSSSHSFEGAIIQPLVGAWSDRTWKRTGRRRPFIVRFLPWTILFLGVTPFIPAFSAVLGTAGVIALVSLAIFLFSVTFNVMYDPYLTLLPDITPVQQRGWVNGIFQALGAGGQVAFLLALVLFAGKIGLNPFFAICVAALILGFIPVFTGLREPRTLRGTHQARYTFREYWQGFVGDPQVLLFFLSQGLMWLGINAIAVNLTPYGTGAVARGGLGLSDSLAFTLPLIILLSSTIFYYPLGILTDRLGVKRVFIFGIVCMSIASILAIFMKSLLPLYAVLALAGLGNAAQTTSSYPLLTRMVFPEKMGLYTGLNTAVTSLSAPLSSLLAGLLIDGIGYNAMFPYIAFTFIAALIPLTLLRMDRSQAIRALHSQ